MVDTSLLSPLSYLCFVLFQGLFGSLDMGGASVEIAFSVPPDFDSDYYVTEMLMGKSEHLYARSYLCYGFKEARARYLAHLVNGTVSLQSLNLLLLMLLEKSCLLMFMLF